MDNYIIKQIHENIELSSRILQDINLIKNIQDTSNCIIKAFRENKKILICGNGGSAADAQHMAAELVGRFSLDRKGLPAIALTTDTSTITAITNDYSYEVVFARQIEALVQEGDIVIGISTSGNSKNITNAFKKAKEKNAKIIGLLGKSGGENLIYSDIAIVIPSSSTPRIQEIHIMIIHILCDLVERALFYNEFQEKILMERSLQ